MGMLLSRHYKAEESEPVAVAAPNGNASKSDWEAYATSQGKDVEGLTRDEIRDLFN